MQDSATFRVPGRHSDRVLFDMTPPTAGKIKGKEKNNNDDKAKMTTQYMLTREEMEGMVFLMKL